MIQLFDSLCRAQGTLLCEPIRNVKVSFVHLSISASLVSLSALSSRYCPRVLFAVSILVAPTGNHLDLAVAKQFSAGQGMALIERGVEHLSAIRILLVGKSVKDDFIAMHWLDRGETNR